MSSRELVERSLGAAEQTAASLNAFRCLRADAARAEADEADRRLRAGERGPLLGVPVAVKDDLDVAGETTRSAAPGRSPPATQTRTRWAGCVRRGR